MSQAAREAGIKTTTNRVGSMWTTFFNRRRLRIGRVPASSDRALYGRFFHAMVNNGVYLAPSQFEAGFVSLAHTDDIIDETISASKRAFQSL